VRITFHRAKRDQTLAERALDFADALHVFAGRTLNVRDRRRDYARSVFIVVPDPVEMKLVNSLARPGGNITGLTHIALELSAKRLAFFKDAFPNASRAALLVNANDQQGMRRYIDEYQVAAVALGMTIQPVEVRSLEDFEAAFDKIVADRP
jgi:ABC-type uncharacterized transport system substrate-binding protein